MAKLKYYNNQKQTTYNTEYTEKIRRRRNSNRKKEKLLAFFCIILVIVCSTGSILIKKNTSEAGVVSAVVVRVVDGDTIVIKLDGQEQKVRLIGVDCPESVSENEEENTIYGSMASDFTAKKLLPGMHIYLTYDIEQEDKYQRILAYVWTDADTSNLDYLFQKQLLEAGYAFVEEYEPNTLYSEVFWGAMTEAVSLRKGLWSQQEFYEDNVYRIYDLL